MKVCAVFCARPTATAEKKKGTDGLGGVEWWRGGGGERGDGGVEGGARVCVLVEESYFGAFSFRTAGLGGAGSSEA